MKRLPPVKRNQLIMVLIATAGLISLVIFGLILPQQEENRRLARNTSNELAKLQEYKNCILQTNTIANTVNDLTEQLNQAEDDVASGDVFAWTYDTIRRFKSAYRVDIPNLSQPTAPADVDMFTGFPYKQVKLSLNGTGYYHDLGKFIADFENKFPHMRVANLQTEPATAQSGSTERLNFRMDIIALIKPNP